MIYVIDIDHTICYPIEGGKTSYEKYGKAVPVTQIIGKIRRLHADGHTIILHTARRMVTHKGDVSKIIADVGSITENWLREHGVPYHQLVFGKPYGDFYVDDKNMTIDEFAFLHP